MLGLALLVSGIMLVVSAWHMYWAAGGQYGLQSAAPKIEGRDNEVIPKFVIFIVALLFFALALLPWGLRHAPAWISGKEHYAGFMIALLFVIRAVGDFRYVGFFKRVYNSEFAAMDTRYFSPLILFLGIAYAVLSVHALNSHQI